MDEGVIRCPQCNAKLRIGDQHAGKQVRCPTCGGVFTADVLEPSLTQTPPPQPAPSSGTPDTQNFPERMKANKAFLGRTCAWCEKEIELGDDIYNCHMCGSAEHYSCHEEMGGCGNLSCRSRVVPPQQSVAAPHLQQSSAPPPGMTPCKFCGEPIREKAIKCIYCGEFQDEKRRKQRKKAESGIDDSLVWWEIVLGIFCGLIGCILGIVYAVQGKKKGWKLILLSIICNILWRVIILALSDIN